MPEIHKDVEWEPVFACFLVPAVEPATKIPAGNLWANDLIARVWGTLDWPKTRQAAFLIAVSGITIALVLAGLVLLAHAMTGQTAAWPVSITLTATVSYKAARRKRR